MTPTPPRTRTYFRHKAKGCSGSLSVGPSEATSAKGQASSIMKAASSSRMGKSVSVMTAIWGDRGGSLRKSLLWAPCMEVTQEPALCLLCPQGWLGMSLATCCPTFPFRPDVTRGTAKEWGGGLPPGVAGTRPLTHTPQAALHPGLTPHEDTSAALSCHVWSSPEWTPRKPREFGWLCSPRWSRWEPSRECDTADLVGRTLGRQVVAPGRGGQAPQVTGTVQTRGGRGSDAHVGSSRAAKSGRVLGGQMAVSELQ